MSKSKFYVVWNGVTPGIYDNWTTTKLQIEGFAGAKYKSFPTREEAEEAYQNGYFDYLNQKASPRAVKKIRQGSEPDLDNKEIVWNSLSVDAACSGNPGNMEYRGVYTATKQELFHIGPMKKGTNNVGEFLALVHGLALLQQKNSDLPIYTDSVNAMKWVKNKKAKTLLERVPENVPLFELIERAENWLKTHTYKTQILKWNTAEWGEIPADFGRK
ncbi:ribonuclease HI [Parabacteroides sp. PFB2-12]|uniref:ribonuclease H family protein n=1 Tax=unclassified Parabacteroides TaxID=2649774 RepID=UPI00247514DA|nr:MULTISPECIES: ribonuclease H family protein [unclassified Parabacteroides]MDH6341499.1 ribonuclease HI [Parabacteroides sp. PM6-13]MDH6389293.1 ribonuclease HI [Parabacteroides sp. PFB2-12]